MNHVHVVKKTTNKPPVAAVLMHANAQSSVLATIVVPIQIAASKQPNWHLMPTLITKTSDHHRRFFIFQSY